MGFIVFDYAAQYDKALKKIAGWLATGKLKSHEDIIEGKLEKFPDTLLKLFTGENTGKLILALSE